MRAFIKLRHVLASNAEFARKLEELEKSVAALDTDTKSGYRREAVSGVGSARGLNLT